MTIEELEQQERDLVLPAFAEAEAWRLGSWMAEQAWERGYPVVIDIRRPSLILFRAVLPGAAPDQQVWAERKAALVLRVETSGRLFAARTAERGIEPVAIGWLDHGYAVTGGSFPVRVRRTGVVAAVSVSGLTSDEDHDFAVEGIAHLLGESENA